MMALTAKATDGGVSEQDQKPTKQPVNQTLSQQEMTAFITVISWFSVCVCVTHPDCSRRLFSSIKDEQKALQRNATPHTGCSGRCLPPRWLRLSRLPPPSALPPLPPQHRINSQINHSGCWSPETGSPAAPSSHVTAFLL